jgi:hypothetical protein
LTGGFLLSLLAVYHSIGHSLPSWLDWAVVLLSAIPIRLAEKLGANKAPVDPRGDGPHISILRWAPMHVGEVLCSSQRGFYHVNNGGISAFEIVVEPFPIVGANTKSRPIAEIGPGHEEFAPVWVENATIVTKWELDVALGIEAGNRIKARRMVRGAALSIPISVIYRDDDNRWYRSSCSMNFAYYGIAFSLSPEPCWDSPPINVRTEWGNPSKQRPRRARKSCELRSGENSAQESFPARPTTTRPR